MQVNFLLELLGSQEKAPTSPAFSIEAINGLDLRGYQKMIELPVTLF
jgi:hypothetical protein